MGPAGRLREWPCLRSVGVSRGVGKDVEDGSDVWSLEVPHCEATCPAIITRPSLTPRIAKSAFAQERVLWRVVRNVETKRR
jgi:hypothetical protein